jgi:anti-anti-sigma factor
MTRVAARLIMAEPNNDMVCTYRGQSGVIFEVRGRGTIAQSAPLRRKAGELLTTADNTLLVDLRHCTYMDSTFLGTLLYLKRVVESLGGRFALISPSPACQDELRQMGLDQVLPMVEAPEPPAEQMQALDTGESDLELFRRNLMEAHQELAHLPGPSGTPFREVAALLTQDWQAKRKRHSTP